MASWLKFLNKSKWLKFLVQIHLVNLNENQDAFKHFHQFLNLLEIKIFDFFLNFLMNLPISSFKNV